jgi:hypothetical protein
MALTYDQIFNLRNTGWVRNRTIVAIGHLATYYAGLGNGATADQQAFVARVMPGTNAEIEASFIAWAVINNDAVQAGGLDGGSITDSQMQGAVEACLNLLQRIKAV